MGGNMAFKDIAGNSRVKRILRRALQRHRLPNSLLFSGPAGVGKTATAVTVAKALNCKAGKDDACEECESCKAIEAGRFPDVLGIAPEKEVIKIEQMRFIKQMAYLKPFSGTKRVFIVEQAEKMNEESANSLLKVLEEPPSFTHVILVTSNPFLILPTIRSRCQVLGFSNIGREEIERILAEQGYPEEQAKALSIIVGGNLEKAMGLDWNEVREKRQSAWGLFLSLLEEKGSLDFLSDFVFQQRAAAKDDFERTMEMFASFCRDIILIKEHGESRFLLNPDLEEALREAEGRWSLERTQNCLVRTESVLSGLSGNRNLNMNLQAAVYYSNFGE
jgi:DNA polymerase-3 subunit delta'